MNYLIFLISIIIFISQGFILFNEETLILICFICFYFVILNKFKVLIYNNFKSQSIKIENVFKSSLKQFIDFFSKYKNWKFKLLVLKTSFINLKSYYWKSNYIFITKLNSYNNIKKNKIFNNKLIYVFQLEQQMSKLLVLIFKKKLKKIIYTVNFYDNHINLKKFKCFKKICLREQIENI